MSEYRNRKAATARTFGHIQEVIEEAVKTRTTAFGWIGGRFYMAYPGGRTIDYTETILVTKPAEPAAPEGQKEPYLRKTFHGDGDLVDTLAAQPAQPEPQHGNPYRYEARWTIEQHRNELIDRLGKAIKRINEQEAELAALKEELAEMTRQRDMLLNSDRHKYYRGLEEQNARLVKALELGRQCAMWRRDHTQTGVSRKIAGEVLREIDAALAAKGGKG